MPRDTKTATKTKRTASKGKAARLDRNKTNGRGSSANRAKSDINAKNLNAQDKRYLQSYGKKLSPSTMRAKWIGGLDEHAERNGQSLATRNHDVIRQWAEERKAVPATVPGTEHGTTLGVLRFDFPGYGGRSLQQVDWDQWFNSFDKRHLVFLYQEKLKNGNQSNFFKLDNPDREDG